MARLRVRGKQPKDEVRPPKPDKTIQTLTYATQTAENIIKGINKANEAKLLEKGYLEGPKYQVSVQSGVPGETTNVNIWERSANIKPGAKPINRVQLSTTGKQHLQHLATENRTTFEHELTKLMTNEGAPPEEILNQINKNVELTSTYDPALSVESQQLTIEQMNNRFEMIETAKANEITATENFMKNAEQSGVNIDTDMSNKIIKELTPTEPSTPTIGEVGPLEGPSIVGREVPYEMDSVSRIRSSKDLAGDYTNILNNQQQINQAAQTGVDMSADAIGATNEFGQTINATTGEIIPEAVATNLQGQSIDLAGNIVPEAVGTNLSGQTVDAVGQVVAEEVAREGLKEVGKEVITQEIGKQVALDASQKAIENQISQELVKTGVQTGANAAANAAFMAVAGPLGWTMFALQMADTIMKMDEGKKQQEELEEEQDIYKQLA